MCSKAGGLQSGEGRECCEDDVRVKWRRPGTCFGRSEVETDVGGRSGRSDDKRPRTSEKAEKSEN